MGAGEESAARLRERKPWAQAGPGASPGRGAVTAFFGGWGWAGGLVLFGLVLTRD